MQQMDPSSFGKEYANMMKKSPQDQQLLAIYYHKMVEFRKKEMDGTLPSYVSGPNQLMKSNPSTKRLIDLKLISSHDLKLNQVNKGGYMKLTFVQNCFKASSIQGLCEDHLLDKYVEISIYNFKVQKNQHYDHSLGKGQTIYVKEPLFKDGIAKNKFIRVDTPLDILFENNPEVKQLIEKEEKSKPIMTQLAQIEKYRQKGIQFMKVNDYAEAYVVYYEGLKTIKDKEMRIKFLLNKAIVCSKLKLYTQYHQDIQKVLEIDPNNIKALFQKVKCLVLESQYQDAEKLINDLKDKTSENNIRDLINFMECDRGFKENKVNWYRVFKNKEMGQYFSDKITYEMDEKTNEFKHAWIIAGEDIMPGQLLIAEKPFLINDFQLMKKAGKLPPNASMQAKGRQDLDKLIKRSKNYKENFDGFLFSKRLELKQKAPNESYQNLESSYVIFQFLKSRLTSLRQINEELTDSIPDLEVSFDKMGYFQGYSSIAHRCQDNVQKFGVDTTLFVYATRPIKKGEKLYASIQKKQGYDMRRNLHQYFGINCKCQLCEDQKYEIDHGMPKANPKSWQFKKYQALKNYKKSKYKDALVDGLFEFYDLKTISHVLKHGRDLDNAAKMFRRIFPMSEEESKEILIPILKKIS